MKRRDFIGKGASLFASCCLLQKLPLSAMPVVNESMKKNRNRVGIQLYSVKDDLAKDFTGSLQKLSDIGFSSVETYGFDGNLFLGKRLKEVSSILDGMGMTLSGTHTGSAILPADTKAKEWDFWKKCCDEIKAGGGKRAIQSWLPEPKTTDDLKRLADHYNRVGEVCKKSGIKFGHHNHSAEMKTVEGNVIFDYLIQNTDPSLVFFQFDLGHALEAGADCVAYLKKYPGRFTCWHATDHKINSGSRELGKGDVDFDALFALAKQSGLEELVVEQESGDDRFACCKVDFDFLRKYPWAEIK